MTSLTHPAPESPNVVTLEPWLYQDNHWCVHCGGIRIAIAVFEIESGRIALCMGCGEEKFQPFTRVTGEVA